KAQGLLSEQYASVGSAASASAEFNSSTLAKLNKRGITLDEEWESGINARANSAQKFIDAYRRYCWQVKKLEDYKLAPFHLMASEGAIHTSKNHIWHMQTLATICEQDKEILLKTEYRTVSLESPAECEELYKWWESLVQD